MEDWLAFIETYSPYLLFDLPWKVEDAGVQAVFEEQWGLLREGSLYVLRYHEGQHTSERMERARGLFEKYAVSVQQVSYVRCNACLLEFVASRLF